jgi:hypothetical protein
LDETDAQGQSVWPELVELARPARERRRLLPETRSKIIIQLCARAPLSVKDLSILLDRSEAYVGDAIRPLVNAGALTFFHPDQPRHPRQKYIAARVTAESPATPAVPIPGPPLHPRPTPAPGPVQPRPPVRPASAAVRDALLEPNVTTAGAVRSAAPRYPNQLTNIAYVLVIALGLAIARVPAWYLFTVVAAAALAFWHVGSESGQYRRFRELRGYQNKPAEFLLLKSAVVLVEIALAYLLADAFIGFP